MESIYYSITWACHRKCVHCYEDRFRPYVRDKLQAVVDETVSVSPRVVANLPERMTYIDLDLPKDGGGYHEGIGRVILSGGEVLIDPIREPALYPLLEQLRAKYKASGGVNVVVQTTGDLVTEKILDDLLERGIWMISIAGMDDFHVGHEGDKRVALQEKLVRWFEAAGMKQSGVAAQNRKWPHEPGPVYSFFGATPDAWIGKLWPRGRAWTNGLSSAAIQDNFCNRWSGGLGFLNHRYSGSEVAIDANGDVFPCCMKTKLPIGNLTEEPLADILDSLAGHPVYEAINSGHPERMGLAHGWDLGTYYAKSETVTPKKQPYRNLCIGCDKFHEEVLAPVIAGIRDQRRRKRVTIAAE